jgi:chorismate--pyruvate lyase
VKNSSQTISSRQYWLKKPMGCSVYRNWLSSNDSLTFRLQQHFDDFSVHLLKMQMSKPLLGEIARMHVSNREPVLVREVHLLSKGQPVVFAHSVLPRRHLRGAWLGLRMLSNKPLGVSLFANPKVCRAGLEYKKLNPQHTLYQLAVAHMQRSQKPNVLWARRSIFILNHAKIMVTEVFLPHVLIHDKQ